MGDIIIKNQDGTNEIFHANKKKISEFTRLAKKVDDKNLIGGENAQLSHPDENQVRAAGTTSVRSPISENIIPQSTPQSQAFDGNDSSTMEMFRKEPLPTNSLFSSFF